MIFLMHFHKSLHRVRFSLKKKTKKLSIKIFFIRGCWAMAVACQGRTDVIAMRLDMLKVGRFFDIKSCQGNWSASKSFTFEEGER